MPLTQLERWQATVAHEKHEGILFGGGCITALAVRALQKWGFADWGELSAHFGTYGPRHVGMRGPAVPRPRPDFTPYFEGMEMPAGAFINGLGVLEIPGGFHHFTRYVSPLRNAERFEELEKFPYPSVEGCTEDGMATAAVGFRAEGRVVGGFVGHMYEDAWQIRGYEQFLMDMKIQPEWCEYILDRLTEKNVRIAQALARAGADYLACGDDVANQRSMMFSVEQWRHFMKPRWGRVWAAARAIKPDIQVGYHSDGNIEAVIPEMIEIGVTILNPIQPECMDPVEIKRKYGKQIVLEGTIGTQTTMPFASPEEVRQVVRERIETLGYDGALILAPTHVLEPEVPLENIETYFKAAKEFGDMWA